MTNVNYVLICLLVILVFTPFCAHAVIQGINYQGKVSVHNIPFTGDGDFMFAILDETGSTYLWSNDGSYPPTTPITMPVDEGLFNVILGFEYNMDKITMTVFESSDTVFRIWFDA